MSALGVMDCRSISGMILTGETDVLEENLSPATLSTTSLSRSALESNRSFVDLVFNIKL
jgi:hypothetical protein